MCDRFKFLKRVIILLLLPFCIIFSNNTHAITVDYNTFALHLAYRRSGVSPTPETVFLNGYGVSNGVMDPEYIYTIGLATGSVAKPSSANYMAMTAKINLVAFASNFTNPIKYQLPSAMGGVNLSEVSLNGTYYNFENSMTNVYTTDWWCDPYNRDAWTLCRTFTYEVSFVVKDVPASISRIGMNITYDGYIYNPLPLDDGRYYLWYYFENDLNNRPSIDFSSDLNTSLLQQQIQIQNATNNYINNISDSINNHYSQENESIGNIEGQSSSDIPNSTNSQTTSIIGVISSFVSALTTVQTGSCELTLPFPTFVGGDTVVNPCNSKEKAPTLVAIGSSMFLIGVFIPFAFIILKMIYNEIRSFTNG